MKYFNSAGASIVENNVIKAQIEYLNLEQRIGGYNAAIKEKDKIETFYTLSAQLLNSDPSEIAFVESASHAWNLVIFGLPLSQNDTLITLDTEFGTNLIVLQQFASIKKCDLRIIKTDSEGNFDIDELINILKSSIGKTAICISHAVAQGSIVYPVEKIGEIAKKFNSIYIVDGCQSIGQMEVDVKKIKCDAIMTSGRKWLRGPRGSGILYVRKESELSPLFLDLSTSDLHLNESKQIIGLLTRTDARRFELWERPIASQIGLAVAIKNYISQNCLLLNEKSFEKAFKIRKAIFKNPKFIPIGSLNAKTSITGFYFKDKSDEEKFKTYIKEKEFYLSYMSEWDFPLTFPSICNNTIRIAPSYYTLDENIDELIKILEGF